MAFDFKGSAKEATTNSVVIDGREKAKLETLALAYPKGLTVIMAELAQTTDEKTKEPKDYCRLVFAEEPTKYVNGGSAFTKVVKSWYDGFNGDVEAMNKELAESGGVKVTVTSTRLQNGNNYTVVNVL